MLRTTDPVWSPFGPLAHPARAASRTRWLWAVPLLIGILAAAGWVLSHDPAPGLALSPRGWVTVRMVLEYAVVAALAVLLTTSSPDHAARAHAHDPNACPPVIQTRAWLECIAHQASAAATSNHQP